VTSSTLSDDARRRHPSSVPTLDRPFAHPSEKVFSQLLTLYGHEWIYEPLEFPLIWNDHGVPTRGFRPDFFLPAHRMFIELTVLEQRLVTKKNRKVRRFRELYPEIPLLVVYQRDYHDLLRHHDLRDIAERAA
jgi:hypoxanthine phosphoribosyltransferase